MFFTGVLLVSSLAFSGKKKGVSVKEFPIHQAAHTCNIDELKRLVEQENTPVDQRTSGEKTALHYAAKLKHEDGIILVDYLMKNHADINARDKHGRTPLHYAAKRAPLNVIQYLVDHGADREAADVKGRRPIDFAIKRK